jgi:hypothetical protein
MVPPPMSLQDIQIGVVEHRDKFASLGRGGGEMVVGPLLEALERQWDGPWHFSTYYLHGAERWNRLRKEHSGHQEFVGRLFTRLLVMDYDRPKVSEKKNPWNSQDEVDDALLLLETAGLWPAVSYVTRHGLRLIYLLDEPVPVTESEHLYRILLARLAEAGLESDDSTSDWTRFFALPYITTGSWDADKTIWTPERKAWDNPFIAGSVIVTESAVMDVRSLRSQRLAPNLIAITDGRPTVQESQRLLFGDQGKQTEFTKAAKKLLKNNAYVDVVFGNGPAPFPPGERNTSIFRMVGSVLMRLWGKIDGMTPQHVYGLLEPCLLGLEKDSCEVMWEQLCRTWEKLHNEAEIQRVSDAEVMARMVEGFREQATRSGASLARMANRLEETEEQFVRRHLILTRDRQFYLMGADGYYRTTPTAREGMIATILGAGLGSIYGTNTTDGAEVPVDQVLRRSCISIDRVDGALGLPRNKGELFGLDSGELGLRVPTHYLVDEEPRFVEEVDEFFRLFAGRNYDRLMDWLGHAQNLHAPICALSISGSKATGKSFLGDLLSARFGPGGKNSESVLTGAWNDGLMRNPVVHADEGIGETTNAKRIDQMLRLTVTGGAMEIRQRRTDSRTCEVYPRLLITANDLDALHTALGKRVLEEQSRDALLSRMLHIEACPEAGEYLAERGGRAFTEKWIKGEALALKHLAHLFATRDQPSRFSSDGRLLVDGSSDRYGDTGVETIDGVLRDSPARSAILAAICEAVRKIATGQAQTCIAVENGVVRTTAQALSSFMAFQNFGTQIPTQHSLSRALPSVAIRDPRVSGRPREWVIDLGGLSQFAEDQGYPVKVVERIHLFMQQLTESTDPCKAAVQRFFHE